VKPQQGGVAGFERSGICPARAAVSSRLSLSAAAKRASLDWVTLPIRRGGLLTTRANAASSAGFSINRR